MSTSTNNRFDNYLAQLESRERKKRRRYQIAALLGLLILCGGVAAWYIQPSEQSELRRYEASSLNYSMVKNLFDSESGEILVAHPAIGVDTISSPEDYLSLKGLLDQLEQESFPVQNDELADIPPTFAVDIAGSREAGSNLIFSIENYDSDLTYLIDFGNGYRREIKRSMSYAYKRSGNYRIRLIATNEGGSSSIYNKSIRIVGGSSSSIESPVLARTEDSNGNQEQTDTIGEDATVNNQPSLIAMRGPGLSNPDIESSSPDIRQDIPVLEETVSPTPTFNEPLVAAEVPPQFPGGMSAMGSFIRRNYRYPREAQNSNIEGKVYVQFVVNADGRITDPRVIKGIGGGCDEEALRLVSMMPNWVPGQQSGQPVASFHAIPITFRLLR